MKHSDSSPNVSDRCFSQIVSSEFSIIKSAPASTDSPVSAMYHTWKVFIGDPSHTVFRSVCSVCSNYLRSDLESAADGSSAFTRRAICLETLIVWIKPLLCGA